MVTSGDEFILLNPFKIKLVRHGSNTCLTFGSFPAVVLADLTFKGHCAFTCAFKDQFEGADSFAV